MSDIERLAASAAAKEIVDLFAFAAAVAHNNNFMLPRQDEARVAAIILKHFPAAGVEAGGDRYRVGVEDACKAMCSCCADTDKWGIAALTEGSMRYWHGDYPCDASPIRTMAAAALRKGKGK